MLQGAARYVPVNSDASMNNKTILREPRDYGGGVVALSKRCRHPGSRMK